MMDYNYSRDSMLRNLCQQQAFGIFLFVLLRKGAGCCPEPGARFQGVDPLGAAAGPFISNHGISQA